MNRFILVTHDDSEGISIEDFTSESSRDERMMEILGENWSDFADGEIMPDNIEDAYSLWKDIDTHWKIVFYVYEIGGAKDQEILK